MVPVVVVAAAAVTAADRSSSFSVLQLYSDLAFGESLKICMGLTEGFVERLPLITKLGEHSFQAVALLTRQVPVKAIEGS